MRFHFCQIVHKERAHTHTHNTPAVNGKKVSAMEIDDDDDDGDNNEMLMTWLHDARPNNSTYKHAPCHIKLIGNLSFKTQSKNLNISYSTPNNVFPTLQTF